MMLALFVWTVESVFEATVLGLVLLTFGLYALKVALCCLWDKIHDWICQKICRIRKHHDWQRYEYGGLGGTYSVVKCSCCGVEKEDSFTPMETYA